MGQLPFVGGQVTHMGCGTLFTTGRQDGMDEHVCHYRLKRPEKPKRNGPCRDHTAVVPASHTICIHGLNRLGIGCLPYEPLENPTEGKRDFYLYLSFWGLIQVDSSCVFNLVGTLLLPPQSSIPGQGVGFGQIRQSRPDLPE